MRNPLRALLLLATLCMLLAACGDTTTTTNNPTATTAATPTPTPVTLNIFAAASLTESFKEIDTKFEAANPGVTTKANFAGSQALAQQIINGASDDVFASADTTNMQKVITAGLISSSQIFAKNKLVVIVPKSNPAHIATLQDLAKKGIKFDIAAASVPAGKYWLQVLDKLGKAADYGTTYENSVKANVISQEDNVKAVVQKVELGEADAGVVYLSDAHTDISKLQEVVIPDNFNVIAQYPIGVTKSSTNATIAQKFVQYILSTDAQAILQKYEFISASSGS